eukprot:gene20301-22290_t
MQVSQLNNVNVYNLSSGKSLPEWISDRKKRQLLKEDPSIRRRIELIQDFEMPTASNSIQASKDENYLLVTGTYKPRIKCFDVNELSLKFERCFDSSAVKFELLADDYSKVVLLQSDRYVEFHAQYGRYYRTRIPIFGRDLVYHSSSCELYFVGAGADVHRLNLEQGRFMQPLPTMSFESNVCAINPVHQAVAVGSVDGKVVCFDPRSKCSVGVLDVGKIISKYNIGCGNTASVTALNFKNGLEMGVGLSSGSMLLYDIRAKDPLFIKDHSYGLAIQNIIFHEKSDKLLTADSKAIKIWDGCTGEIFTSIEPDTSINDVCIFPSSGLVFHTAEAEKMGIYYIPELGNAPKWCSFLDSLTEELEENSNNVIYDDYKFITKQDLNNFGLSHLIGTNMLRAYMHGYFMDIKLFHQVQAFVDPFAYENFRKEKIKSKIALEQGSRIMAEKLPKVNKQLAAKFIENEDTDMEYQRKKKSTNVLQDERFSALFENPDFEIDEESEQYKLMHPVLSKFDVERKNSAMVYNKESSSTFSGKEEENNYISNLTEKSTSDQSVQLYQINMEAEQDALTKKKFQSKSATFAEMLHESYKSDIIKETGLALGSKEVVFKMPKSKDQVKRR